MAEEIGLSQAVRDALRVVGVETGKAQTVKIREWITKSYPHLAGKLETPGFSTTLAGQRKKMAEGAGGGDQAELPGVAARDVSDGVAKATVHPAATPATEVDIDAMIKQERAKAIKSVAEIIGRLKPLINLAGGKDALKKLIDVIDEG